MPAIARKDGEDTVASPDGTGSCCALPTVQSTDKGSPDVFANSIGVVRLTDTMIEHLYPGPCCDPHAPALAEASPNVFVNNLRVGRQGDAYTDNGRHVISSGSPDVFVN